MKVDCLIVGQGIAGSVLSYVLHRRGYSVAMVDNGNPNTSSRIAAGLWNPVSFRHLHLTWRYEEFYSHAELCYRSMEEYFNTSFFHPLEIARIFPDHSSANEFDVCSVQPGLKKYLVTEGDETVERNCNHPFGHALVKHAGWLNIPSMMTAIQQLWLARETYRHEEFDYSLLQVTDNTCIYKDIEANNVVFATGMFNENNPWFNGMKIIPNKGQVSTVQLPGIEFSRILNFGHFLLPLGNGNYRLGSTYEREFLNEFPEEEVRDLFLKNLFDVWPNQALTIDHFAGLRPTTKDRKPVLGRHPEFGKLFFINGLGSKGVLLAPWHADHLADAITLNAPIEKEVSLFRYWK